MSLALFSDVCASDPSWFLQVETQNVINGLDAAGQVLPGVLKQSFSSQWPVKEGNEYKG